MSNTLFANDILFKIYCCLLLGTLLSDFLGPQILMQVYISPKVFISGYFKMDKAKFS